MCTPNNLRLFFMGLTLVKTFQMIFLLVFGIITSLDLTLHQAYGSHIRGVGIGLALCSVCGGFNLYVGFKGSQAHNKFLLLLHLTIDAVLFLTQLSLGWALLSVTFPLYPSSLRSDCVKNRPEDHTTAECREYIDSDRSSGFQIVWKSYYFESGKDPNNYQKIVDIQRTGQCCGFGAPVSCRRYDEVSKDIDFDSSFTNGYSDFYYQGTQSGDESRRSRSSWDAYVSSKNYCEYDQLRNQNWYPSLPFPGDVHSTSEECNTFIDAAQVPPVIGGCLYDLPLGSCKNTLDLTTFTGCLFTLEETLNAQLAPPATIIILSCVIQLIAVACSCCYCWKRKTHDTFPDMLRNVPYDPYKNKEGMSAFDMERDLHKEAYEVEGMEFLDELGKPLKL